MNKKQKECSARFNCGGFGDVIVKFEKEIKDLAETKPKGLNFEKVKFLFLHLYKYQVTLEHRIRMMELK